MVSQIYPIKSAYHQEIPQSHTADQPPTPRNIDNFLYRHFIHTNHYPSRVSIQPVKRLHTIIIQLKDTEIFSDTK